MYHTRLSYLGKYNIPSESIFPKIYPFLIRHPVLNNHLPLIVPTYIMRETHAESCENTQESCITPYQPSPRPLNKNKIKTLKQSLSAISS